jgi:hypothetical protein
MVVRREGFIEEKIYGSMESRVYWRENVGFIGEKKRVYGLQFQLLGSGFRRFRPCGGPPPLLSGLRVQGLSGFEGGLYMAISLLQRQRKANDAVRGVDHSKLSRV